MFVLDNHQSPLFYFAYKLYNINLYSSLNIFWAHSAEQFCACHLAIEELTEYNLKCI